MKKINGSVIQDGLFAMKTAKGSQTVKTICNPFQLLCAIFTGKLPARSHFLHCLTAAATRATSDATDFRGISFSAAI